MLLTSFLRSSSNSVTGSAGVSSTGAGHLTISNKAMALILPQRSTKVEIDERRAHSNSFLLFEPFCG
jgi:hypothetical protein